MAKTSWPIDDDEDEEHKEQQDSGRTRIKNMFKDAVRDAFEDEVLTKDEESILDGIRKKLGLTEDERDEIYDEVLEELGTPLRIQSFEIDEDDEDEDEDGKEGGDLDEDGEGDDGGQDEDGEQEDNDGRGKKSGKENRKDPSKAAVGAGPCLPSEGLEISALIAELKNKLDMAESEASQAQWLIDQANEERDGYKAEAEELGKRVVELETRIDVLEMTLEKAGVKVKKRPQTRPMPPKPKDEETFWELRRRQQTVPVPPKTVKIIEAFCGFCGTRNKVQDKGAGEAIVFDCSGCGKKSFFRQD